VESPTPDRDDRDAVVGALRADGGDEGALPGRERGDVRHELPVRAEVEGRTRLLVAQLTGHEGDDRLVLGGTSLPMAAYSSASVVACG
jgi:hypothetical protein